MSFVAIAQMLAALAVTLGLFGLGVVVLRRFAPGALLRLKPPAERRLAVVESLILDPQRRLVLVRYDQEERLLLLGEGRMLAARPAAPRASLEASADA